MLYLFISCRYEDVASAGASASDENPAGGIATSTMPLGQGGGAGVWQVGGNKPAGPQKASQSQFT